MFDIIIIGAGIVGLAIARSIGETTNKSVLVIEKEESFGRGASNFNSFIKIFLSNFSLKFSLSDIILAISYLDILVAPAT